MPIIIGTVPQNMTSDDAELIRLRVKSGLTSQGVPPNEITIEFIPCIFPERLVINYFSRSDHLKIDGQRNKEAEYVGNVFKIILGLPVECFVASFEKSETGIFVSK